MDNLICYDYDGNIINNFTQWDVNQTITIKNLSTTKAPIFHFANKNSKEAFGVQSTMSDGNITAKIPNVLLREALNLQIYIFIQNGDKGKTIIHLNYPVYAKPQPNDYLYTDNVEVIYIKNLMNDVKKLETELTSVLNNASTTIKNTNTAKTNAEKATAEANKAANNAQNIANAVNEKLENGEFVGAKGNDGFSPIITVESLDNGHKVTITDNAGKSSFYVFNGEKGEQGIQGEQGVKGDRGEPFEISKTYSSIEEMNADFSSDEVKQGSLVLVSTGSIEDEDNAKLFVKDVSSYTYITNLSNATTIKGEKGKDGSTATFEIREDGYLYAIYED